MLAGGAESTAKPATAAEQRRVISVPEFLGHLRFVFPYSHRNGDFRAWRGGQAGRERLIGLKRFARGPDTLGIMRRRTHARRKVWRWHRHIDAITVYGPWSVPSYVIACESGGSWSAYNPSGAAGVYQIMPFWGRPFPVRSARDMAAHHVLAARIWDSGRGAGNWTCA